MEQNYLPLFRKYRPQSFKDVVGQESLVKALSNAIELNRIANAYLFCGPRGTGKTSCARIFAKSLNCVEGPTLNPCQKCASCVDITNAAGLDVIEIDAASNRGIQDAKDLIAQVQYAPINGRYKIFIIDEVHMLSNEAFNALLKTFEEPPKNVIFILATTEPHKVLETIVSRCQRFDLRRITTQDIVKRLREISDLENIKITDEALFTIAKNVSGGLRDSLALLDQVSILGVKEEITKDLIEELLGKINLDILLKLLNQIYNEEIENSILTIDEIYSKGNEPRNLAENFIEFLRNAILVLDSDNKDIIKNLTTFIDEDIEKIKSCGFDKNKIIKILNNFIEYYKEIKISSNPYLWVELACISGCKLNLKNEKTQNIPLNPINNKIEKAINIQAPIKEIKKEIPPKTAEIEQPKETAPAPESKPSQVPSLSSLKDGAEIWLDVISAIQSLPTRALYSGTAKLVKVENNTITLGFTHENALNQAKMPHKLEILHGALNITYPEYKIEMIKITQDTKVIEINPKAIKKPQNNTQVLKKEEYQTSSVSSPINNNKNEETDEQPQKVKKTYSPKVQDMIEQFNGKIIED